MATELGNTAATRAQGTAHAFQHAVRRAHPMQGGIAEHCVELAVERQRMAVHHLRIDTARTGRNHQFRRRVHAVDACAAEGQFGAEHAIATAQVEDAFTGARPASIA
ncbi:hypothetical protein G6F59_017963 [Rhizopus arrhizus]|nr:hypothetical protein G6F59_017963 [Rhizopus arrhizus]